MLLKVVKGVAQSCRGGRSAWRCKYAAMNRLRLLGKPALGTHRARGAPNSNGRVWISRGVSGSKTLARCTCQSKRRQMAGESRASRSALSARLTRPLVGHRPSARVPPQGADEPDRGRIHGGWPGSERIRVVLSTGTPSHWPRRNGAQLPGLQLASRAVAAAELRRCGAAIELGGREELGEVGGEH